MVWPQYVCVAISILSVALFYVVNERSWLWRRCLPHRHAPLFITTRAPGVEKSQRPESYFCWELVDPLSITTPRWGPNWLLVAVRLASVLLFILLFFILEFVYPDENLVSLGFLRWFTDWTWILFGAVSVLGAGLLAAEAVQTTALPVSTAKEPAGSRSSSSSLFKGRISTTLMAAISSLGEPRWSWLRKVHLILFGLVATLSLMLTLAYWTTVAGAYSFFPPVLLSFSVCCEIDCFFLLPFSSAFLPSILGRSHAPSPTLSFPFNHIR
jgi:hypothetical protein